MTAAIRGATGPAGPRGVIGPPGPRGARGEDGAAGAAGAAGATGATGAAGPDHIIRGRTIVATTPTIGKELCLNSDDEWQPVLKAVHVDLYGAVADADGTTQATGIATGTDNAAAIESAIRSLDAEKGGVVQFGYGHYRIARTIIVDRPVIFRGMGAATNASGTTVWTDYRMSAFRLGQGTYGLTTTGNDDSGFGTKFKDLMIRAVARDSATSSGDWDYLTYSVSMTDAAAARFSVGQLISIGAANQAFTLQRVVAETTLGSPTVIVTGSDTSSSRGIYVGQYLIISTAYPAPVKVTAIVQAAGDVTVTMASNAAATLADAVIQERPALLARITGSSSAAGTTTFTTDMANGGLAANLTAVDIRDASAGIDCRSQPKIHGCIIHSFEGPGVYIGTNGLSGWACNNWQIIDLHTHSCRNAVVCHGQNSQSGTAINVNAVQSREWAVIEDTQAGNTWIGNHADGGYGMLVRTGCSSTIIGAYHETGTYSSYSSLTQSVGGTGSFDFGGVSDVGGKRNRLDVGEANTHEHQLVSSPDTEWLSFASPTVSSPLKLRRSDSPQDGAVGYIMLSHSAGTRRNTMAIVDDDGPAGYAPGEPIFVTGFRVGGTAVNLPDAASSQLVYVCDEEPTTETFDTFTSGVKWRDGDIVFITGKGSETAAFLRCTRTGNAAPLWAALDAVTAGDRMRLNADDGYYYTADNSATTGAAEPASGATIAGDGTVNWTRQTASALFERVGAAVTAPGGACVVGSSDATSVDFPSTKQRYNGNARHQVYTEQNSYTTTDATATVTYSFTPTDNCATKFDVAVVTIKDDASLVANFVRSVRIKRDGGTVTLGTVDAPITDPEAGLAAMVVDITLSGTTVRVMVSGIAATNLRHGLTTTRYETTYS